MLGAACLAALAAGADAHHRAVRFAAHLKEVRIAEAGTTFYVQNLGQICLLAWLVNGHHIADLHVQKIGSVHEFHAEPFNLVQVYYYFLPIKALFRTADLDRSEGEALPHQRNTGDTTSDGNRRIHGSKEIGLNAGAADDAPVVRFDAQRLLQGQARLDG